MRKVLVVIGSTLLVIVLAGSAFVASRQHLTFDAAYPKVAASSDSAVIERGHYIVRNLAPCASCHGDPTRRADYARGDEVPLVGGYVFDIPPGKFYTRNLTPDAETGLGKWQENEFVQAIKTGKHLGVGRPIMPPMPWPAYRNLTDTQLRAIYAYLRSIPPVKNKVPDYVPASR